MEGNSFDSCICLSGLIKVEKIKTFTLKDLKISGSLPYSVQIISVYDFSMSGLLVNNNDGR